VSKHTPPSLITPKATKPRKVPGNSERVRLLETTAGQQSADAYRQPKGQNLAQHLRTPQAAAFLGVSASYLNHKRLSGDGPPYRKYSRKVVVYDFDELREWASSTSKASTSGSPSG
jgi:hypothetical protein